MRTDESGRGRLRVCATSQREARGRLQETPLFRVGGDGGMARHSAQNQSKALGEFCSAQSKESEAERGPQEACAVNPFA